MPIGNAPESLGLGQAFILPCKSLLLHWVLDMETFKNFTLNNFDLRSLRVRLILSIIFFIAVITATLQYYSLNQFEQASTLNLEHEGLLLSDTLEATTLLELADNNITAIQEHINRLVNNRDINDIEINILSLTKEGSFIVASNVPDNIEAADEEEHIELLNALSSQKAHIFFEMETEDNDPDDIELDEREVEVGENHPDNYFLEDTRYLSITTPLIHKGQSLGGINVKLSLHPLDVKLAEIRQMLFISTAVATLIVLLGLGLMLNKKIFAPIAQMQRDMNQVANGNLDLQLAAGNREDEIGQLANSFNSMAAQLKKTRTQLHQYLNPMAIKEAYRRANGDGETQAAEEKDISVLFVDVVSFTATSEQLGPVGTVEYLNRFHDHISQALVEEGGTIDKIIADEVVCVFEGPDHAHRAVATARCILERLEACDDLQVRIGINSGTCIIADIGSHQGGRFDRTIIGDTVNVAQRLMTIANPGSGVFSLGTYRELPGKIEGITPLAPQKLKGKAFPVKAFQIMGKPVILPAPRVHSARQSLAIAS